MMVTTRVCAYVLAFAACVAFVNGHGAIVWPRSRNSIDYLVNVNTQICANVTGAPCNNGQASFYYSQGCFIGCPECDHTSGRLQASICNSSMKPTINNPYHRSVNRNATAGSPTDIYKFNPWRAPGSAPVAGACGLAGGTPWGPNVAEAGDYVNTTYAHHGTNGTDLPPMPTGTVWQRGGTAEVAWNVRNNHGGGYQYRLCPRNETLSEACFQRHPLDFVEDKQAIVFPNGSRVSIIGTFVKDGVLPVGSTWAMLPIPSTWLGPRCLGDGCESWENRLVDGPCIPCPMTPGSDCSRCDNSGRTSFPAPVPGVVEAPKAAVLDEVFVPEDLPAGEYVLGWRYDCEATAQVWSNCADITLA